MARRKRLRGPALLIAGLGAILCWVLPTFAAPLPQIVQPGDVATPTATFTIILVPTATTTPVPVSPVDESGAGAAAEGAAVNASLLEPVGLHGAESFSTYIVRPGDTLLTVALEVGVDVADLPCAIAPTFQRDQPLVIGNTLEVPPPSWQCHQVEAGESLTQIAARYGVEPDDVLNAAWNELDVSALGDQALREGSYVRIPPATDTADGGFLNFMLDQPLSVSPMTAYAIGGTKPRAGAMVGPIPKDWPYGSGNFMWPIYGWLSQGYREDHRAIDIAAPTGTIVTAADRGVVIRAGWNDQGYGNFVIIDHNIDYLTLYAHLDQIVVKEKDIVAQGQVIGTVGSTGNSTGPHLHFEIRDFGRRINPLDLLVR
jgi:murein DD-endopeptidase MepM/ murein hydrolase activator NlpD